MELTKAKLIFENIDVTNEVLTKKKHRELVKKYHTDLASGDSEKIKEINVAYEVIKNYQMYLKLVGSNNTSSKRNFEFEKAKLEEELAKVKKDIKTNSVYLKKLLKNIKYINSEINISKKSLHRNILYWLFENKSNKMKIVNFLILLFVFEILFFIFTKYLYFSLPSLIIFNILVTFMFTMVFVEIRRDIKLTKNFISYCCDEKNKVVTKIHQTKSYISFLKQKEERILNDLKNLEKTKNEYYA